jgi:hypothetical protein
LQFLLCDSICTQSPDKTVPLKIFPSNPNSKQRRTHQKEVRS